MKILVINGVELTDEEMSQVNGGATLNIAGKATVSRNALI